MGFFGGDVRSIVSRELMCHRGGGTTRLEQSERTGQIYHTCSKCKFDNKVGGMAEGLMLVSNHAA